MSVSDDLFALLSTAAGVTALVGQRIYPDALPEKAAYPAIVYAAATPEIERLLDGTIATQRVELSLGCWAPTRTAADAVGDAVTDALAGTAFYLQRRDAAFDPETGLFAALLAADIIF